LFSSGKLCLNGVRIVEEGDVFIGGIVQNNGDVAILDYVVVLVLFGLLFIVVGQLINIFSGL
jgi:hypothetical protein